MMKLAGMNEGRQQRNASQSEGKQHTRVGIRMMSLTPLEKAEFEARLDQSSLLKPPEQSQAELIPECPSITAAEWGRLES